MTHNYKYQRVSHHLVEKKFFYFHNGFPSEYLFPAMFFFPASGDQGKKESQLNDDSFAGVFFQRLHFAIF